LHDVFHAWFRGRDADGWATFDAYRKCKGVGMTAEQKSTALLACSPHVGAFLAKLFGIETDVATLKSSVQDREPLWRFKREFAKKRVTKADAGKAFKTACDSVHCNASEVAKAALALLRVTLSAEPDEELAVAQTTLELLARARPPRPAARNGRTSCARSRTRRAPLYSRITLQNRHFLRLRPAWVRRPRTKSAHS